MNVKAAAKALNVHYRTIYNMINSGRLTAEKVEGGEWEISNEQIHEILSRAVGYGRKADELATAVYSLEEFKRTFSNNTLRMVADQCSIVVQEYESGTRGRSLDLAIKRLEERLSRLKLAHNASEFMSLALQKANQYTDASITDLESEINMLEGK